MISSVSHRGDLKTTLCRPFKCLHKRLMYLMYVFMFNISHVRCSKLVHNIYSNHLPEDGHLRPKHVGGVSYVQSNPVIMTSVYATCHL
jgi:hypothetical protein